MLSWTSFCLDASPGLWLHTEDSHLSIPSPALLPEPQTLPFSSSAGKSVGRQVQGRTPTLSPGSLALSSAAPTVSGNGSPAVRCSGQMLSGILDSFSQP